MTKDDWDLLDVHNSLLGFRKWIHTSSSQLEKLFELLPFAIRFARKIWYLLGVDCIQANTTVESLHAEMLVFKLKGSKDRITYSVSSTPKPLHIVLF